MESSKISNRSARECVGWAVWVYQYKTRTESRNRVFSITGRVVRADGGGIGGAFVRLKGRRHSLISNYKPDGKASLAAMPAGQAGSFPEIRRRFYQLPLALASGKVPQKSSGL